MLDETLQLFLFLVPEVLKLTEIGFPITTTKWVYLKSPGNRKTRLACITTYSQLTIPESIILNKVGDGHRSEKQARTQSDCDKFIRARDFMKR